MNIMNLKKTINLDLPFKVTENTKDIEFEMQDFLHSFEYQQWDEHTMDRLKQGIAVRLNHILSLFNCTTEHLSYKIDIFDPNDDKRFFVRIYWKELTSYGKAIKQSIIHHFPSLG